MRSYVCPYCGGSLLGDGFTMVVHCESVEDISFFEPDSGPIYCDVNVEVQDEN